MDTSANTKTNNNSDRSSFGSTVHEILHESRRRHVVIRKSSGQKVFECSLLLALLLSIGAPVLPAFMILGVLVQSISVSQEKK